MSRKPVVLALSIIVLTAGCNGFLTNSNDGTSTPSLTTPETAETGTPSPTPRQTPFPREVATDEIVLQLSDTGFGYNLSVESVETRENVSGETRQQLEDEGILKRHTRTFTRGSQDEEGSPSVIRSTVIIYENESKAEEDVLNSLATLGDQGGTVSQVQIASGVTADQVRVEDSRGRRIVTLYGVENNMVYSLTIVGGDEYYESRAEELFIEMVVDVP